MKNADKLEPDSNLESRLADTAHPIEFATDDDTYSYWLSQDTDKVTIDVDLMYGQLQVRCFLLEGQVVYRLTVLK